ncbi:MAG: response regulator [Pseudomonadota bacterium]
MSVSPGPDAPLILIVEDEPKLAEVLGDYLRQSGYRSHWLADGDAVLPWFSTHSPQLILLDLMLPGTDGMTLCRELRAQSTVPILIVSARVDELDRLLGLELGADDYICKPFSPREVVARVRATLRRIEFEAVELEDGYRELKLDRESYRAFAKGVALDLTPVEFRLLEALVRKPGRVLGRDQLMGLIYTDGRIVSDRTVDTHVKNLRRKLEAALPEQELISSIYGVGYRLE